MMTPLEIAAFSVSLASAVLALIAIFLSIYFYKISNKISNDIEKSVLKMEVWMDKFYTDTFNMTKDLVMDVSKHAFPDSKKDYAVNRENLKKKSEEKIELLKKKVEKNIFEIIKKQKVTNEKVEKITKELSSLVDDFIVQSTEVGKKVRDKDDQAVVQNELFRLKRAHPGIEWFALSFLYSKLNWYAPERVIINALIALEKKKLVELIPDGVEIKENKKIDIKNIFIRLNLSRGDHLPSTAA